MAQLLTMPKLSDTMSEGRLLRWIKKEGERVSPGDVIAEVETDKANMDFEAFDEGVLLKILVGEGQAAKVGAPVAVVGDAGEDISAALQGAQAPATTPPPLPAPSGPPTPAMEAAHPPATAMPPASSPAAQHAPATTSTNRPEAAPPAFGRGGRRASPLARRLADDLGLRLDGITGSGPGGRVVARDVQAAATNAALSAPPAPVIAAKAVPSTSNATDGRAMVPLTSLQPGAAEEVELRPLSPMRRTIAQRLTAATSTIPHFYLTRSANAEALSAFRTQIGEATGEKLSFNDLVLKAVAGALRKVPEANCHYSDQDGGSLIVHRRVHLGVAVAVDDGLITPVVRDADVKSIGAIAREVRELADRARARKLRPDEYRGSTFSVSNLGMYGIERFQAVINPPEAGILAVGAVQRQPVVKDGALSIGTRMDLTLSCDHRVIDGAIGARLLGEIVAAIEHPWALAL
jgi:pyruvate dehydrogenase E2 component (dihydrolipoamide acetyltransferase)